MTYILMAALAAGLCASVYCNMKAWKRSGADAANLKAYDALLGGERDRALRLTVD